MKVKLLTSRAGADFVQNVGDVIEVSAEEAKRMMESQPPQCVPVREAEDVETTAKKSSKKKAE